MNVARFGASASLTAYGTVLIAGGNISAGPGSFKPTSSVEIYDPATNTFASTTPSMNGTTGSLAPFATLLQNGAVLLIANNPAGAKANELFEAPSEVYPGAFNPHRPQLQAGRQDPTVTLLRNGEVLIAGGFTLSGC